MEQLGQPYGVYNCEDGVSFWFELDCQDAAEMIPLFALESGEPIADFDIVAFSVGYEMAFTAILNMLDLAGIPLRSAERTDLTPLVIAGGTAMYNAEPIADFVDIVSLGEGEDVTVELQRLQEERLPRRLVLLPRLLERRRKKPLPEIGRAHV